VTTLSREALKSPVAEQIRDDSELLEAVLTGLSKLELAELLDDLVTRCAAWSGATIGLAWGEIGEGSSFRRAAATFKTTDPDFEAIGKVKPAQLRRWLGDAPRNLHGLGPLDQIVPAELGEGLSGLSLPVVDERNEWGGLIWLGFESAPSAEQVARLQQLLEHSKIAVGHGKRVAALRRLIIKDDTAACYNRRYFDEFLPEELARAGRFRSPVSLIFLDMDNLKEVNTLHGHAMGSRTLLEVSKRIRSRVRKFDKLFRFGGDEFCIVLPETEWKGAVEVAERVRDAVNGEAFLQDEVGGGGIGMTASLGIAAFPLHARTQQGLIALADEAMQRVKKSTKNAVGVADAPTGQGDDRDGSTAGKRGS
jgi:diguanylate cyclase (GGDEF)-like protein